MPPEWTQLEWTHDWGPLGLGLGVVLALAVVLLAWWSTRPLQARQRVVLLVLRAGTASLLLAAMLQPSWVELRPRADDRVAVVLLDASASMRAGESSTRIEAAKQAAAAVARSVPIRAFALEPAPRPVDAAEAVVAGEGTTDLLGGLRGLAEGARPPGMTSVVLISDGRDHGALGKGQGDATLDEVALALGVPIHTLIVGDDAPLRDVVVGEVRSSRAALCRSPLPVDVDLDLGAFAGGDGSLGLVLELDGVPQQEQRLMLDGPARRTAHLELTPTEPGPHVLTVRAVPLPGEATAANNRVHVPIHVVRDRIRVMHLAGHPSLDTRFLRGLLRAREDVDLVSFYIMIGRAARVFVDPEDTTLIPFPTQQLFEEALADFDVVIFHDFAFAQYGIDRYVPNRLGPWIERGGAFLSIGGRGSLSAGGYEATSIWPWMPVDLDGGGAENWHEGAFTPKRTDVGESHPITALRDDRAENGQAWEASTLPGHNLRLLARSGDPVLLQASDGSPLLAIGRRGKGRVAALGTDGTWSWAFPQSSERARDQARRDYQTLWNRLLGWLLRDPALAAVQVQLPDQAVPPGTTFDVVVTLRGRAAERRAGVPITCVDSALPDGKGHAMRAETGSDGKATFRVRAVRPGPHRLSVSLGDSSDDPVDVVYAVAEGSPEELDLRPNPALLGRIALAGGGLAASTVADLDGTALLGPLTLGHDRVRHELWSHPSVVVVLLALLLLEWWLRRRWGLV